MNGSKETHDNRSESSNGLANPSGSRTRQHLSKHTSRPKVPMHHNSSQIQDCLNPVRGIRDAMLRQGLKPVNHAQQNVKQIRLKSQENLKKRELEAQKESTTPAAPLSAMANVKSSGYGTPQYQPRPARSSEDGSPSDLKENARPKSGSDMGIKHWIKRDDFGKVPHYLQMRKIELARKHAEEQAKKEAALIPPGMRIMPDEERLDMLRTLAESKAEVQKRIQALPFVIETPGQIRQKQALEKRMQEIEQATSLFSRTKILVQA
eukprot:jgi/Botrbrau1/3236/Bobra.174_1s0009.1